MKPLFGLLHPAHVLRAADKQQPREDLLDERADLRKRQPRSLARAQAFGLEKRVGDRADDHVMLPARIRPALEMIEAEFGFEVLIVLFDGPALMRQPHELWQRGGRRQRDEVVLAAPGRARAPARRATRFRGRGVAAASRSPASRGSAAKSASHGGLVPLRHATRRHARGGSASLSARTLTGVLVGPARRGDCAAAVACDRRAASGVPRNTVSVGEMPSAYGQPQPMQRLTDRAVVAVFGIGDDRRQRHAGGARPAHQRQRQPPLLLKDDRRGNPRRARAAPDRSSTPRADRARRPSARRAARSTARPSPRLGNSPPCPARRSTAARRRPNAGPTSGSSFRRGSECPCAPASPPAAAATRPRHPTGHA